MRSPRTMFRQRAVAATADGSRRAFVQGAIAGYHLARAAQEARCRDWDRARHAAAAAKSEALEDLDGTIERFAENFARHGGTVHWARDAAEARSIVLEIVAAAGGKTVIKSKCMTSEEIGLNDALEQRGFEVVESDLGEFIQQLRGEPPYHFVFPCMHVRRDEIGRLFAARLGAGPCSDPRELTMIARRHLRRLYVEADVGITGANFLVAETGQISITENEGNARLTAALPRVHIVLAGIEKVVPRLDDLAVLLPMLAVTGTGQPMTCYNTLYAGPKRACEADGPLACHVVLLDNGRSTLLADPEAREALRCIRCGACLSVCPVFAGVGGLTYGTTYQGPIGAVITPHLRGVRAWGHLASASSLCGACSDTCPVRIDLHRLLLHNRRIAADETKGTAARTIHALFGFVIARPRLFALSGRALRRVLPLLARLPIRPLRAWTGTRDLPPLPVRSFRDAWRRRT